MRNSRHDTTMAKRRPLLTASDRKRFLLFWVAGMILLVAVSAGLYIMGRKIERSAGNQEEPRGDLTERFQEPRTVAYNGQNYWYRAGLTTVLFMGIDPGSNLERVVGDFRNGGQADFLLLLVIDHKQEKITSIQIDRDTMAEITVLGVLGNPAGTRTAQICLSHGFGDGGEQSCLFTVDAVCKHLLGVDINFYVAMNLDGITTLNERLGGVTVTLEDDFTSLDPEMHVGETITLHGKQAEYYVRSRMGIGEGTNASRMTRQKDFLNKAGDLIDGKMRVNVNFIGGLFDALRKDLTTNMSRGRMINEANASRNYSRIERTLAGEHTVGLEGFVEFHTDTQDLETMVLDVFYEPVNTP